LKTAAVTAPTQVAGVWDGVNRSTIEQGMGAGDTRIEKQEWHLTQSGDAITGYYIAALTFVSGRRAAVRVQPPAPIFDGAALRRVREGEGRRRRDRRAHAAGRRRALRSGRATAHALQRQAAGRRPDAGGRGAAPDAVPQPLARLRHGRRLRDRSQPSRRRSRPSPRCPRGRRRRWGSRPPTSAASGSGSTAARPRRRREAGARGVAPHAGRARTSRATTTASSARSRPTATPTAAACPSTSRSRTRYQVTGEVRGNQIVIYENSFEVLEPSSCDNGKQAPRRVRGPVLERRAAARVGRGRAGVADGPS
jgi:hypothetical protein